MSVRGVTNIQPQDTTDWSAFVSLSDGFPVEFRESLASELSIRVTGHQAATISMIASGVALLDGLHLTSFAPQVLAFTYVIIFVAGMVAFTCYRDAKLRQQLFRSGNASFAKANKAHLTLSQIEERLTKEGDSSKDTASESMGKRV